MFPQAPKFQSPSSLKVGAEKIYQCYFSPQRHNLLAFSDPLLNYVRCFVLHFCCARLWIVKSLRVIIKPPTLLRSKIKSLVYGVRLGEATSFQDANNYIVRAVEGTLKNIAFKLQRIPKNKLSSRTIVEFPRLTRKAFYHTRTLVKFISEICAKSLEFEDSN